MRKYFFVCFVVVVLSGLAYAGQAVAQIEPVKGKDARAEKENGLISQVQAAVNAKNWQNAKDAAIQLIAMNPNRWEYQKALGDAQYNLGQFQEALDAYEKAISPVQKSISNNPKADTSKTKAALGEMLTRQGNCYLKLKKNSEAIAAYTKAAEISPNPGIAYFNICATQYNMGNMEGALTACEKAISIDPNKADAYFIKGSAMFSKGTLDKQNKYTPPAGTAEALTKYLELAPEGPHASDVKQMLEMIGVKIETDRKSVV
jgi:tetratricopeptide (TPR) repeat protein